VQNGVNILAIPNAELRGPPISMRDIEQRGFAHDLAQRGLLDDAGVTLGHDDTAIQPMIHSSGNVRAYAISSAGADLIRFIRDNRAKTA
jgi:hypothetical protein